MSLRYAGFLTNGPERVRTGGFCTCGGDASVVGTGTLLTLEEWMLGDALG